MRASIAAVMIVAAGLLPLAADARGFLPHGALVRAASLRSTTPGQLSRLRLPRPNTPRKPPLLNPLRRRWLA